MKFESIKKGDIVYIASKVGGMGGFHSSTYGDFFLPQEVIHVTEKFFDAGDKRFYKDNGRQRTSNYGSVTAFNLGDNEHGKEVKDQTEEHTKAVALLRKLDKARSLVYRYYINHKIWSEEDLDALTALLEKNKDK